MKEVGLNGKGLGQNNLRTLEGTQGFRLKRIRPKWDHNISSNIWNGLLSGWIMSPEYSCVPGASGCDSI